MAMAFSILSFAFAPALLVVAFLLVNIVRGILSRLSRNAVLRQIDGPRNASFLAGNLQDLYGLQGLSYLNALSTYGRIVKLHGLFGDTLLAVSDPHVLSQILINQVQDFPAIDISGSLDAHTYFTGLGLLSTNGPEHRRQRKLLNPVFSHAHMRNIAPLMRNIASQLKSLIARRIDDVAKNGKEHIRELDCADILGRAALEFVAQCGFGHTFHAMEGDANKYVSAIKDLVPTLAALGALPQVFVLSGAARLPPRLLRLLGNMASFVSPTIRRMMQLRDIMHDEMHDAWKARKLVQGGEQNEVLGILLEANENGQVSDEDMSAQALTLLSAGAETTSTTLCRILHLLALHPTMQDNLCREVLQALSVSDGDGTLDYDTLMALPLLDAVCKETLRVFAPTAVRHRRCIKESVLSTSDGSSLHIPAGTEILVNVHAMNIDAGIWGPDASVWRPERWLEQHACSDVNTPGVYANMLSFMAGPKSCVGMNFAILEMKITLATLLPSFRFKLPAPDVEIEWRLGVTVTPSVKGYKGLDPRMPLLVGII
ncbi:unnamed protein product [Peniophora sp. CBMAI 1063]|nr:unnamed protein product [Peniophora sp. CBMAI 1063]